MRFVGRIVQKRHYWNLAGGWKTTAKHWLSGFCFSSSDAFRTRRSGAARVLGCSRRAAPLISIILNLTSTHVDKSAEVQLVIHCISVSVSSNSHTQKYVSSSHSRLRGMLQESEQKDRFECEGVSHWHITLSTFSQLISACVLYHKFVAFFCFRPRRCRLSASDWWHSSAGPDWTIYFPRHPRVDGWHVPPLCRESTWMCLHHVSFSSSALLRPLCHSSRSEK